MLGADDIVLRVGKRSKKCHATAGVAAPSTKRDVAGRFVDEVTLDALAEVVARLAAAEVDGARRDALWSETLDRLGIPRDKRRADLPR